MRCGHAIAALAVLLILFAPLASAAGAQSSAAPPAPTGPPAFDRWVNGPVRYLMSEKELEFARAVSEPAHGVAFRHWFWERRDPLPATPENEFRNEFEARVSYANKEFGGNGAATPGWATPKGVVYLLLGRPTRVVDGSATVYGVFDAAPMEIWTYERKGMSNLDVPFVVVDKQVVLLTTPDNVGTLARLDAALRDAAMGFIHNRDLPFNGLSPVIDAPVRRGWPASGSVCLTGAGIDAQISVPLTEIYGQPEGDSLRVELLVELASDTTGERVRLGSLRIALRPEVFSRWRDRPLTVALWLPADAAPAPPVRLAVTEVASGRVTSLDVGTQPGAVARAYPVAELLGRSTLLDGRGAAFAFVRASATEASADHEMWVLRPPQEGEAVVVDRPIPSLWLGRRQ